MSGDIYCIFRETAKFEIAEITLKSESSAYVKLLEWSRLDTHSFYGVTYTNFGV